LANHSHLNLQHVSGFFDYYIIPLARKLATCGCFGVSSDEYLNYAVSNRAEWKDVGMQVVDEMLEHAIGKLDNAKTEAGVDVDTVEQKKVAAYQA